MHSLLNALLEIVYPLSCGGCGAKGDVLCKGCLESLRIVEEGLTCPLCGRRVGTRIICGECLQGKRGFHEGYYGFYYENRLREAMHAFKFSGRKDIGRYLVTLIRQKISSFAERFDCIVPIPLTEKRLKERGFNQSFLIGEGISRIAKKPLYCSVLRKARDTKDQYTLSKEERKKNIKGAFAIDDGSRIKGKKVLLVDDLFTTGYTAREGSRALVAAKADRVVFFALARTPS